MVINKCALLILGDDYKMNGNNAEKPVVILNDIVVFPGTAIHFDIKQKHNLTAIEQAMAANDSVLIISKRHSDNKDEYGLIGTIADVRQLVKLSTNKMRVMLYGTKRVMFDSLNYKDKMYIAQIIPLIDSDEDISEDDMINEYAMARALKDIYKVYCNTCGKVNDKLMKRINRCNELDELIDTIGANSHLEYEEKCELLALTDKTDRYDYLAARLVNEIQIIRIRDEYRDKVKKAIDENQKEYYLREQMKLIREELGDSDSISDSDTFLDRCRSLNANDEIKDKIEEEIRRFRNISTNSSESTVLRGYIETLLDMPWNNVSLDNNDIDNARQVLDANHYGLTKVKERIIEMLAVRQLTGKGEAPIMCLVGPPGTGKTSIAKSVAEALSKKYIRICLGGVKDEAEIRGHRKTYVGAMPGRIVMALKKAKVSNPLILLDEIDKVSNDYKGDTFSALLEVLDPEQNEFFTDHYVEVPVDLSEVLFICTANSTQTIPGPLLDRMEIIEVSGYTENEKFHIAKKHLVAKQRNKNGIKTSQLSIADSAIKKMIINYTREAGVRKLERTIASICRKAARAIVSGEQEKVRVNASNLEEYLGKVKYEVQKKADHAQVGIVRGLAWTSVGGETLEIEVNIMPGKGELTITGQLGDVMKESAMAAITYVRSISEKYDIQADYFQKNDIHIHIPEGAIPKDGPSAGITMATAVLSAVTDMPVRDDLAMTGEVTLRGRVLPIGGLKEKLLAAYNAGISTVLVPERNRKDVEEIDNEITGELSIEYVRSMEQVIDKAIIA